MTMLLACLKSYAQNDSSKGEFIQDSSNVIINIDYIRLANQKLIERNYLIEANKYKDSIIVDYKNYIKEYERLEKQYKNKINECNRINEELNNSLNKQKKISLICGTGVAISVITIVLISVIN